MILQIREERDWNLQRNSIWWLCMGLRLDRQNHLACSYVWSSFVVRLTLWAQHPVQESCSPFFVLLAKPMETFLFLWVSLNSCSCVSLGKRIPPSFWVLQSFLGASVRSLGNFTQAAKGVTEKRKHYQKGMPRSSSKSPEHSLRPFNRGAVHKGAEISPAWILTSVGQTTHSPLWPLVIASHCCTPPGTFTNSTNKHKYPSLHGAMHVHTQVCMYQILPTEPQQWWHTNPNLHWPARGGWGGQTIWQACGLGRSNSFCVSAVATWEVFHLLFWFFS